MGSAGVGSLRPKAARLLAVAVPLAVLAGATGAGAAPPSNLRATPLTPVDRVQGVKADSSRLAKTDRSLLGRTSSRPMNVVVKLDYDSLASYDGQIKGLPATSPDATGRPLDRNTSAYKRYSVYVRSREQHFLSALDARIPAAQPGERLRTVYGGLALTVPANEIGRLLRTPGVVAVQRDSLRQPQTDSSPEFIGAPTIYGQLGQTASDAGKGVIVGVLDSGAWPEHPSYRDPGNLPAPPAKADGTPRTCDFGDNPLTPAADPFVCNNKLISGQPFLATYLSLEGPEVYNSARDSDGHGTHTSTTAAGGPVADANPLGISRGPIHGIAPGAMIAMYKVCGREGCFSSDSVAAVAQAILDGVQVINFSISGGEDPYTDPVELAFLDAYASGVVVSASAGNDGPGAATSDHASPWVMTVAASTQTRTFRSAITLSGGGATATISGASITAGTGGSFPVVDAGAPPYNDRVCGSPAPAGIFTGKIVVCHFTNNRVLRGFNVRQGGAQGMILANDTPFDVFTDNHFLPAVQIDAPETATLTAFLAAHPGTTASWGQGAKTTWQGDRVTYFSSRGPGTEWIKPNITAPGLHVLAGMTPTPDEVVLGPAGNLFQVIAGTSMSSPHIAGSAALLRALHPDWTPGQVMSALQTTAKTSGVTKSDGTTPADPFDDGSGRVDLTKAGDPGLTFDETAADYATSASDPNSRVDLNIPSVDVPTMPGVFTTTRTAKNVTNKTLVYAASASAPSGAAIVVTPLLFSVKPGASQKLTINIAAPSVANGQYFGRINLTQIGGNRDAHLPVAFVKKQGIVTLAQDCAPASIQVNTGRSTCTVTVHNDSLSAAPYQAASATGLGLQVTTATNATRQNSHLVTKSGTLAGRQPDAPSIAPGSLFGYIPLDLFTTAIPISDEQALNFNVPSFVYHGQTYNRIGVTSDGYLVAGGANAADDVNPTPQALPDPARPNDVLAPYWTDLDGSGAPGIYATVLTDGVSDWIVVEWRLNAFNTSGPLKVFQTWIGVNGTEDITFAYDPANMPGTPPAGFGLTVGAENAEGNAGDALAPPSPEVAPTEDQRVTSTPGAPGGTDTYSFQVKGTLRGSSLVGTEMTTPLVRGITTETDTIDVTR
jgi:subtilisin family serine protease